MAFPQIAEKYGSLSYTGFAKEASNAYGTPVAATTFLPMSGNTMEEDPGWFAPHLMQNLRDYQVYNLQGEAKYSGTVTGPIFPSNAIEVLSSTIGADGATGYGVAAATPTTATSTTLNGATLAGATTVTVTLATGFTVGQQIAIDTTYNQEIRKITNVASSVLTLADPLIYPHATATAVVTGAPTTTMSALSAANATTITVTSAAGLAQGNIIQIDVNSVTGSLTSEIRAIASIAGSVLTLSSALVYGHASGTNVILVGAGPYTHTLIQQNSLPSLTVEKAIGGFQSLQFAGCRVGKFDIKMPAGNDAAEISIDLSGQSVAVLNTPTPISIVNELPFVFAEANLSMYGTLRTETSNVALSIDNGLKETYTYANQHGPSFITPVTLHVNGSVDVVFDSLNDTTYGDFNKMNAQTLGSLQFSLVHPSTGGSITFYQPQIALAKYANDVKMEDVVMSSLTYEATRPLTGAALYTLQATVINSVYLAY
jgi:hypothetical protein